MGRIDDALRRSNLDVGLGTGAPAPAASTWHFEPREHGEAVDLRVPAADNAVAGERKAQSVPVVSDRLVVSKNASPLLVEQFRSLAATLLGVNREQPVRSLIVMSASPGDGKSHVAVNLALTLSGSYRRRVLLIDADLRRPSLHQVFGVANEHGLNDALRARTDERAPVVQISDTLTLLPAGRPEQNPLAGLSSDRMRRIVADGASQFDWLVVDSPPVGVLADGRLVSEMVDAAILVVRAGVTRFPDLEAAADTIGRERILGIVLNGVEPVEIRGEDYYRRYYHDRDTGEESAG